MPHIRTFDTGSSYILHACPDKKDSCSHSCPAHVDDKGRIVEDHLILQWNKVGDGVVIGGEVVEINMTLAQMKSEVKLLYKNWIAGRVAVSAPSELAKTTFS